MSGLLDMHSVMALQNGWRDYADSVTHFKALFYGIDETVVTNWHTELTAKDPVFRIYGAPSVERFPQVVVKLLSEGMEQEPLGGYAYTTTTGTWPTGTATHVEQFIIKQNVEITIATKNAELTRALHVACRAVMQRARRAFIKAGYQDLSYTGTDQLDPQEELAAEELGIYIRRQNYEASSFVTVPRVGEEIANKKWFVLEENIKTTANPDAGETNAHGQTIPDRQIDDADGAEGGVTIDDS